MNSRYKIDPWNHLLFDSATCYVAIKVKNNRIDNASGMLKSMDSTSASSWSYMMQSTPPGSSMNSLKY